MDVTYDTYNLFSPYLPARTLAVFDKARECHRHLLVYVTLFRFIDLLLYLSNWKRHVSSLMDHKTPFFCLCKYFTSVQCWISCFDDLDWQVSGSGERLASRCDLLTLELPATWSKRPRFWWRLGTFEKHLITKNKWLLAGKRLFGHVWRATDIQATMSFQISIHWLGSDRWPLIERRPCEIQKASIGDQIGCVYALRWVARRPPIDKIGNDWEHVPHVLFTAAAIFE